MLAYLSNSALFALLLLTAVGTVPAASYSPSQCMQSTPSLAHVENQVLQECDWLKFAVHYDESFLHSTTFKRVLVSYYVDTA